MQTKNCPSIRLGIPLVENVLKKKAYSFISDCLHNKYCIQRDSKIALNVAHHHDQYFVSCQTLVNIRGKPETQTGRATTFDKNCKSRHFLFPAAYIRKSHAEQSCIHTESSELVLFCST